MLLALAAILSCRHAAAPSSVGRPAASDLAGTWVAELEHDGQRGRFAIEITANEQGTLGSKLSLPDIDVWSLPAWPVTLEGEAGEVRIGPFLLSRDARAGTLSGVLPEALVPVHRIPFVMRRGSLPTRAPKRERLPEKDPLWSFDAGSPVWAGLTYEDGVLYAGSDDGTVRALNARTGREIWAFRTGGAIRAEPVVDGAGLLVHSDDGRLYRLDKRSGSGIWQAELGPPYRRLEPGDPGYRYDGYASAPAVAAGLAYLSHDGGRLLALETASGTLRWELQAGDHIASTPLVHGGRVFFGSFDGSVIAADARTGEILWHHDTGAPVTSSPALYDGRLIVGSRSFDLLALSEADGSVAWSHYVWFSWIESSAVVSDGIVYVGSSDAQQLQALDAARGALIWRFDTGGSAWARPALSEEAVYIGSVGVADYMVAHEGGFYAVDRHSGRGLWRHGAERPEGRKVWGFAASPAVGAGLVFAAELEGHILAFPRGAGPPVSVTVE